MAKQLLHNHFIAKLKPNTRLFVIRETKHGFKYSVRDFVSGMTGNSSWCYGQFMTVADAIKAFPNAVIYGKST